MSDPETPLVFTDPELEAQTSERWYSWRFKADAGAPEQLFEFGMAMPELDASNSIAKYLGVDTLPEGSTLMHPEVSPLKAGPEAEPETQRGKIIVETPKAPPATPPTPPIPEVEPLPETPAP